MDSKQNGKFQIGELIFGSILILAFLVIAILAPIIAPPEGDFPELPYIIPRDGYKNLPLPPNPDHPLGTLPDQYDIFYGLIWGTRRAFLVGISITLGRTLIGLVFGLISGYYKGIFSNLIMRVTDAFMSIPTIAAAALMFAYFGEIAAPFTAGGYIDPATSFQNENRNAFIIILSLILFGWMQYVHLVRANVISEREKEYVVAAKSVGSHNGRIISKHILPNATKGLYVLIASDIGGMVAVVSLFYFIGLIGNSPYGLVADWGQILSVSRDWIVGIPSQPFIYWYTFMPAVSAIALFTIGWSMIGDGVRNLLDPRLSVQRKKKISLFTKWFKPSAQAQPKIPIYQAIRSLNLQVKPESDLDPILLYARSALKREDLPEALHAYTHLVWEGKNIGTVIRDLQSITWRYPKEVEVWKILGNALKQVDRDANAQQAFEHHQKIKGSKKSLYKPNAVWNNNLTGKLAHLGWPALAFGLVSIILWFLLGGLGGGNLQFSMSEILKEAATPTPTVTLNLEPFFSPPRTATATPGLTSTPVNITDIAASPTETPRTLAACPPENPSQAGRAVEIIDGNTIKALIDDKVYVVRYIGVDVPAFGKVNEPYGPEATFKNADLVYSKEITLIPDGSDKDDRGRLLRYVLTGDTFVNYELIAQGFAQVMDVPSNPYCSELFQQAEKQAILYNLGKWVSLSTPNNQ